jgi:hypothetical protein
MTPSQLHLPEGVSAGQLVRDISLEDGGRGSDPSNLQRDVLL